MRVRAGDSPRGGRLLFFGDSPGDFALTRYRQEGSLEGDSGNSPWPFPCPPNAGRKGPIPRSPGPGCRRPWPQPGGRGALARFARSSTERSPAGAVPAPRIGMASNCPRFRSSAHCAPRSSRLPQQGRQQEEVHDDGECSHKTTVSTLLPADHDRRSPVVGEFIWP